MIYYNYNINIIILIALVTDWVYNILLSVIFVVTNLLSSVIIVSLTHTSVSLSVLAWLWIYVWYCFYSTGGNWITAWGV